MALKSIPLTGSPLDLALNTRFDNSSWLGLVLYKETEKKQVAFFYVNIPLNARVKKASAITGVTLLACGLVWLMQYSEDQIRDYWWYVWPVVVIGFVCLASELLNARIKVLTPAGELEEKRLETQRQVKEEESQRRYAEIVNRWYIRYPIATFLVYVAWWFAEQKGDQWWLSIGGLMMAAYFAREISLLVIIGVVLYMLFQGIAALPVSVAVIIGAIIISNAIRN
jgi:hypothetical protein